MNLGLTLVNGYSGGCTETPKGSVLRALVIAITHTICGRVTCLDMRTHLGCRCGYFRTGMGMGVDM